MRRQVIRKLVGLFVGGFGLLLLPSLAIALVGGDGAAAPFAAVSAASLAAAFGLWWPVRDSGGELRLRDGFLLVSLFWLVAGTLGALPLVLVAEPDLGFVDALFESMSGLTTTGASVVRGLDALPPSVLFYRQLLQWVGGMAIVILAVAIQPMLGVGGMQFYRAGTPGPLKETRLTPRITETARVLSYIYLALTLACTVGYFGAGLSPFDALGHAFSTVSLGGFSTHDASLGHYDSPWVEVIAAFFMLLAGVNFSLHFLALRHRNLKPYVFDAELRSFLALIGVTALLCLPGLLLMKPGPSAAGSAREALFHAVSIGTNAGFTTSPVHLWPGYLPLLLLFVGFVGGCAGSTAGGLKMVRCLLLYKQGVREIRRLIHPHAVLTIRLGDRPVNDRIVDAVWGFFATYVAVFGLLLLATMASGVDHVTAFSSVAACLNNLGPALGAPGHDYAALNDFSKLLLTFAMLLGRLEILILLVLLTPAYWRA